MATSIQAGMTPTAFQLTPDGGRAQAAISIQNAGTIVDQYTIEITGLEPSWFSLSQARVALFPGDKDTATIALQLPRSNDPVRAGTYQFTVTVRSGADPAQFVQIRCSLVVGAIQEFRAELSPRKVVGRKGRFRLTVQNNGNADLDLELEAQDAEEACAYAFSPEGLQLGPGQKRTVQLLVKPRRGGWIGPRQQFDFQVQARPSDGQPKLIPGQIVHSPRFRTWKPFRVLARLAILGSLFAAVLIAAGGWSGFERWLNQLVSPIKAVACSDLGNPQGCPTATDTLAFGATPATLTPTWTTSPTPAAAQPTATATACSPAQPTPGSCLPRPPSPTATPTHLRPASTASPSATAMATATYTATATAAVPATSTATLQPTWTPRPTSTFTPTPPPGTPTGG